MIYSQKKTVSAGFCGADAKLSLPGILTLMDESITELMGALRVDGLTTRERYNAQLMFSRNRVKILRPAAWNEDLTVESFFSRRTFVRLYIDSRIKNGDGETVAYGRVEVCAVDLATGQLCKMEAIGIGESMAMEVPQCDLVYSRKVQGEPVPLEEIRVRSCNIDYAGHTNNIEYVRFVLNTHTVAELLAHPVREIELNYFDQSREGDTLCLLGDRGTERSMYAIRKGETTIFSCELFYGQAEAPSGAVG